MGYKSSYKELVHTQPPSFIKKKGYKIRETIGKGSTGEVFRAKWNNPKFRFKHEVALKIVKKETIKDDPWTIAREISFLKDLNHEFIVSFYDSFESNDKYFISLELAAGGNLAGKIGTGRIREIQAMSIMRQLIHGVRYLHSLGIVHRDLKPSNLLLKNPHDTHILISGFGVATKLVYDKDDDEDEGRVDDFPEWETDDGLTGYYGTREYLAPEALLGFSCQTAKIDSFSIGVILCEMLSGCTPWSNYGRLWISDADHIEQVVKHKIIWEERYWGRTSIGAKDLMTGLLAVDPGVRMSIKEIFNHPWMNMRPAQTQGHTNAVFPKSKTNPYGITSWHKSAINASRARFCQRALYVTKPHLRSHPGPHLRSQLRRANFCGPSNDQSSDLNTGSVSKSHSHSNSHSDTDSESDSNRVDTPRESSDEKVVGPYKYPAWYRALEYIAQRA